QRGGHIADRLTLNRAGRGDGIRQAGALQGGGADQRCAVCRSGRLTGGKKRAAEQGAAEEKGNHRADADPAVTANPAAKPRSPFGKTAAQTSQYPTEPPSFLFFLTHLGSPSFLHDKMDENGKHP